MRASHREHRGCPEFQAKTSELCAGGFVDRANGTPHRSRCLLQSVSPGGLVLAVRGLPLLIAGVFIHAEGVHAKLSWCLMSHLMAEMK